MKKIILPLLALILISCEAPNYYYQVYKTNSDNGSFKNNKIVFEDNNCEVHYNLWGDGGNIGFSIYNKTDSDLTINLTKTFFVLNGISYEYFQNRTFSKSTNNGTIVTSYNYPYYWNNNITNVSGTSSTSYSTQFIEKPELTIPPKTLINISEFKIVNTNYLNCDLEKYPWRKNVRTLNFGKNVSPFVFYNLITYSTKSETLRIENKFYVSEITNYPSSAMDNYVDTSECGRLLYPPVYVLKNASPDKFYLEYKQKTK